VIWVALAVLGVLAIGLVGGWIGRGRSDAAGNALESAYLAIASLILVLLAVPVLLGWWLDSTVLMATPLLLIAVPLTFKIWSTTRKGFRRWRMCSQSRMPTKELRDLEMLVKTGNTTADLEKAGQMLAGGISVTDPAIGRSLVRTAIRSAGANEKLQLLLKAGADPSDPQALQDAVWHSDCLFTLFAHGVSPRALLPSGDPVLFAALDDGSTRLMELLVEAGADPDQPDRDGWPLVVAYATRRRGHGVDWRSIVWLVEHGADPFRNGPDGTSLADVIRGITPDQIDPESLATLRACTAR
jgi:hypothetical protein